MPGTGGLLMHAELKFCDSTLMLSDENPMFGTKSPATLNGTPSGVLFYVPDVDKAFAQAVSAGATAVMPVSDMFWGDRYGKLKDPFGHEWSLATHTKDMTPEEIGAAAAAAFANMGG